MRRRTLLGLIASGAVAGCAESLPIDSRANQGFEKCNDHHPSIMDSCENTPYERIEQRFDEDNLYYEAADESDGTGLKLTSDKSSVEIGAEIQFELANQTASSQKVRGPGCYHLQRYTDNGWVEIRMRKDDWDFCPDLLRYIESGEQYSWKFIADTSGFATVENTAMEDIKVCPDIEPAQYRFVYFGLSGDTALGTCFEITS